MARSKRHPRSVDKQSIQKAVKAVQTDPAKGLGNEMNINFDDTLIKPNEEETQLLERLQTLRDSKIIIFVAGETK